MSVRQHLPRGTREATEVPVPKRTPDPTRRTNRVRRILDKDYADDWSVLFLRPGAPKELVDAAYRILSKKYHSDVGGNDEAQKQLNKAYDRLNSMASSQ